MTQINELGASCAHRDVRMVDIVTGIAWACGDCGREFVPRTEALPASPPQDATAPTPKLDLGTLQIALRKTVRQACEKVGLAYEICERIDAELMLSKASVRIANALKAAVPKATAETVGVSRKQLIEWDQAEVIVEQVTEELTNFSHDSTRDNAICLVREIMSLVIEPSAVPEATAGATPRPSDTEIIALLRAELFSVQAEQSELVHDALERGFSADPIVAKRLNDRALALQKMAKALSGAAPQDTTASFNDRIKAPFNDYIRLVAEILSSGNGYEHMDICTYAAALRAGTPKEGA